MVGGGFPGHHPVHHAPVMSDQTSDPRTPLRQFRVTITEDLADGARHAHLSWRTFPCAADRWDGRRWFTFTGPGPLAVESQEALRGLLGALAAGEWVEGKYPPGRRP